MVRPRLVIIAALGLDQERALLANRTLSSAFSGWDCLLLSYASNRTQMDAVLAAASLEQRCAVMWRARFQWGSLVNETAGVALRTSSGGGRGDVSNARFHYSHVALVLDDIDVAPKGYERFHTRPDALVRKLEALGGAVISPAISHAYQKEMRLHNDGDCAHVVAMLEYFVTIFTADAYACLLRMLQAQPRGFGGHGLDACYSAACPGRAMLLDGSVRAVHLPTPRKGKADRSGVFVRRKQIRAIRAHYRRLNRTCWESNGLKGHGVTARNGTQVACVGRDNSQVVMSAMEARMTEWRG